MTIINGLKTGYNGSIQPTYGGIIAGPGINVDNNEFRLGQGVLKQICRTLLWSEVEKTDIDKVKLKKLLNSNNIDDFNIGLEILSSKKLDTAVEIASAIRYNDIYSLSAILDFFNYNEI